MIIKIIIIFNPLSLSLSLSLPLVAKKSKIYRRGLDSAIDVCPLESFNRLVVVSRRDLFGQPGGMDGWRIL